MIYLDNAATTWPKPDSVLEAMQRYLRDVGATPGRSGHRLAVEAERIRLDAREAIAELVGLRDPLRVVFTLNATTALNIVIQGLLPPGSHAVATGMEHNAVLRPLRELEAAGRSLSLAECRADGSMDPAAVAGLIGPRTRLIVLVHASNVCGTILPIREVGAIARERGVALLVDATQTAGCLPLDLERDGIDLLAFTGHKGLLGPPGTGGLAIRDDFDVVRLPPLVRGGTGSRSEHEVHPDFLPDRFEAGTPNGVGLAGLAAGVRHLLGLGVAEIRSREATLAARLIAGLRKVPGVSVQGPVEAERRTGVVSFTVADHGRGDRSPSDVAYALDERFGVLCRPGLHCAPRAHRTLGTFPEGTVRLSPGPFTTEPEVDRAVAAVAAVADVAESRVP